MRQIDVAAAVELFHQRLIDRVSAEMTKAYEVQRNRGSQFKSWVRPDPSRKLVGQPYVLANVMLQALDTVVANHEPQLERPEPAAELNVPVAVVKNRAGFAGLVLQIFRKHAQSLDQRPAVGKKERAAIEVGEHPLVRIEAVAIGKFQTVLNPAKFFAQSGSARHRGVDMEPNTLLAADGPDFLDGVHCVRG